MTDDKDDLSRAREQVELAKTNLMEFYVSKIRESYLSLESEQRTFILNGLEIIVTKLESGNLAALFASPPAYDPRRALEVRTQAGLTRAQLAKDLGLGSSGSTAICRYEMGTVRLLNPPRGKTSKAYLEWLKEQGYNPFKF